MLLEICGCAEGEMRMHDCMMVGIGITGFKL